MNIPLNTLETPKITDTVPKFISVKDNIQKKYKKKYLDQIIKNKNFLKEYFNENNIEVIGTPHDSMYPLKYFYDTHYHMNTKGSKIRTKELIKIIKSKI